MPCYDAIAEKTGTGDAARVLHRPGRSATIALAGNPNTGKTSLFNSLTGLRARTANYSGTTVEVRIGKCRMNGHSVEVIDLPGMYSLRAATPEEKVAHDVLLGNQPEVPHLDAVVVIADADNLERNLFLVSQMLETDVPVVVALNMMDIAHRHGIEVDVEKLGKELGCPVVPTVARTGKGLDGLKDAVCKKIDAEPIEDFEFIRPVQTDIPVNLADPIAGCGTCGACPFQSRYSWTEQISSRCVSHPRVAPGSRTERIDSVLTRPTVGIGVFMVVMLSVFYLIFSAASIPMDLIDALFGRLGALVMRVVPAGDFQSLIVDGVIAGVGGILVFLPQICILFFFLALLEDSGYLARAAFVMDRLMRRIGLPGTAFIPLLSAHACAIPAIMAARVIEDRRDRLVTILVAPLMTCSARIPVYAMVTALLFPDSPAKAAIVFTGAYGLGIGTALIMSWVFKKTILAGESKPLVLELPGYRLPSLKSAVLQTWDRAAVFVRQAGTVILLISIVLWTLATYPKSDAPPEVIAIVERSEAAALAGDSEQAGAFLAEADALESRHGLADSYAGRLGRLIEPVVAPLGFDWQIGIGVVTSFAAREVIVSTLAIVYGVGAESVGDEPEGLYDTLRNAKRHDGTAVFTTATSVSLLIFYVLAMQCLPTQVVTRRETGTWKWAIFQFVYMTALAYGAAFVAYQGLTWLGVV